LFFFLKSKITNYLLRHPQQFDPMPSRLLKKSAPQNGDVLWCSSQGYIQESLWCVAMENAHQKA
jgi:hypothetical protein